MPASSLRSLARRPPDAAPSTGVPPAGEGRRLRIALVTEYYYPHLGGICEHVHFFAQEARRRGHEVDIITSQIPGARPAPHVIRLGHSVPVYANGSMARVTVGWGLRGQMREVLRRGQYDIVHVHSPLTPVLPLLAIAEARCPVVGTFHTYFDGRSLGYTVFRRALQKRLDRLDAAIAVSQTATTALTRYFEADWRIIPNGIDTTLFRPDAPAPKDVERDVPTILFLGRFDPRNGLTRLIDSFRAVRGRRRPVRLVVVGDGPLREYYYRAAAGDPDIHFAGSVLGARPGYYANSTIYACPTTKASFGITLLEAMACRTPIVCSDIPGFRDVVAHEREALLVPCGDNGLLADALVRLLDDAPLRERLAATGREHSLAYAWPRVTDEVLGVYGGVLGHTAAHA